MADLCARSEQCAYDIREKLFKAGLNPSAVEETITFLINEKFIDDNRFAGSFARDKVKFAGWGRNKIRMALALKRINSTTISEALDSIPYEMYQDSLMRAAKSKARNLELNDYADKVKLMRHLASRGFTSSEASEAVRLIKEED